MDNPVYKTFKRGKVEIWYQKPATWEARGGLDPNLTTYQHGRLQDTHVQVASVETLEQTEMEALEEIFCKMQGDVWSPKGEARHLIRSLGLHHTSMSVGDVVKFPNGHCFACMSTSWTMF